MHSTNIQMLFSISFYKIIGNDSQKYKILFIHFHSWILVPSPFMDSDGSDSSDEAKADYYS